jgi:FKBP-type peptidyl-prolyl cis-trans isomerase FklB
MIAALIGSLAAYADEQPAKAGTPVAAPTAAATPAGAAPVAAPAAAPAVKSAAPVAPGPLTDAQASYRIGLNLGEQLLHASITADAVKPDEVARGVREAMRGATMTPEDGKRVNDWVLAAREAAGERNHAAAQAFLAKNGKAAGVVTTASGLQYKIIAAGSGNSPSPTDEVTVQYRGTLLNGTEFDSSYKRGQPAVFPVNGVIKGWQEALVLMKPGAKWKLFVPPALAYDLKSPPGIPPGSALVFDVELVSVKPKT